MKRSDFVRLMGNIDEKYLKEADNYSARPRNWVRVTAVAACFAIIATALPLALILNREDTQTDAPVNTNEITTPIVVQPTDPDNTNKNPLKIVYGDASLKEVFKGSSLDIEIRDSSEIDLDLSSKVGEIDAGAEIPAKLYYTIGGKDLVCTFDTPNATKLAKTKNENLKELGNIARYKVEGSEFKDAYVEYCYTLGRFTRVKLLGNESYRVAEDFSTEMAKKFANRDLVAIYGEEFCSDFEFEYVKYDTNGKNVFQYVVAYRRYIHGYPTDEKVIMYYNTKGELGDIVTTNLGLFNDVNERIDAKTIADAKEEALSLIDVENEPVEQIYLTMDIDGGVYWHVVYNRKMDHDTELIIWEYNYKFY